MSINDQLVELAQAVGRIEQKVDALSGLPARVSRLEHFKTRVLTIVAVAGSVGGAATAALADTFLAVLAPFFKH